METALAVVVAISFVALVAAVGRVLYKRFWDKITDGEDEPLTRKDLAEIRHHAGVIRDGASKIEGEVDRLEKLTAFRRSEDEEGGG